MPFDPSLLVHFRERIKADTVNKINQEVIRRISESESESSKKKPEKESNEPKPKNRGKLILDATCAPADISYPTDLKLLNQARVQTEKIIDSLYKTVKEKVKKKPRTYRAIARKEYLKVTKLRRPSHQQKLKAIKKQLNYVKRNLFHIEELIDQGVEAYYNFTGYYPESVHVDRIYRTRENRAWCKERGIRISGPPLGRPPASVSLEKKKQQTEDEKIRNSIEGKFGQSKRRFGLDRVMTKLSYTSETAIAITFLVMNLSTWLLRVFRAFFCQFFKIRHFFNSVIVKSYRFGILSQDKVMNRPVRFYPSF